MTDRTPDHLTPAAREVTAYRLYDTRGQVSVLP